MTKYWSPKDDDFFLLSLFEAFAWAPAEEKADSQRYNNVENATEAERNDAIEKVSGGIFLFAQWHHLSISVKANWNTITIFSSWSGSNTGDKGDDKGKLETS